MHWYLIHTKPRQEQRALLNLVQQGYECYLPVLAVEKVLQGVLAVVDEPLFARYLFIRLDASSSGKSWSPIRSTKGVSRLVTFGSEPVKVDERLIEVLRSSQGRPDQRLRPLFAAGERVLVAEGPFAGLEAIYQMNDGEGRAMVLIQLLSKPISLRISPASLQKAG